MKKLFAAMAVFLLVLTAGFAQNEGDTTVTRDIPDDILEICINAVKLDANIGYADLDALGCTAIGISEASGIFFP